MCRRWLCWQKVTSYRDRGFERAILVQNGDHARENVILPESVRQVYSTYLQYKAHVGPVGVNKQKMHLSKPL